MSELWSESRGDRGYTVWVGERKGKRGAVFLRWNVGKKQKWVKTQVGRIRDDRGRVLRNKIQAAQMEADAKIAELKGERPTATRSSGPLSIAAGIADAFGEEGLYPDDTPYTRQTKAYAEAVQVYLGVETWQEITKTKVRLAWRKIFNEAGGSGYGRAEKITSAMYTIAAWLEEENKDPNQKFPHPFPKWRSELKEYWKKRGNEVKPYQPRYTPEEKDKLFRNAKKADPRLQLAVILGAPLRGGQVLQTRRSNCEIEGDMWRVQIPYVVKRKKAPMLVLGPTEKAALHDALTEGYLIDLEAAYLRGELQDYALFPGGKLNDGKAVVGRSQKSVDRSYGGKWLHKLEAAAGVRTVKGRAWYGLRRLFADLFETAVDDDRVKDDAGGWRLGSEMRRTTYQDQAEGREIAEKAAEARERLRPPADG